MTYIIYIIYIHIRKCESGSKTREHVVRIVAISDPAGSLRSAFATLYIGIHYIMTHTMTYCSGKDVAYTYPP